MVARRDSRIDQLRQRLAKEPASLVFVPLADLLAENGEPAEAVAVLEEGLGRHPEHGPALVVLGRIQLGLDRPEEGVRNLETVLGQNPENPVALRLLADHYLGAGDAARALPFLETLLEIEPHQTRWRQAQVQARAALVSDRVAGEGPPAAAPAAPADGLVTLTLVDIMINQGYHEKALAALRRMEARDPGRPEVRERLAALEARQGSEPPVVRDDLVSAPDRRSDMQRHKAQFGQWIEGLASDGRERG